MATPRRINTLSELQQLARDLRMRHDWHEPDEQNVTAEVRGVSFDNAGFWGEARTAGAPYEEMHVVLSVAGEPVAMVNLATLLALACRTFTGE